MTADSPAIHSSKDSGSSSSSSSNNTRPTCSLWTAFDKMQLCYTAIPQVKHYYRYGTFRDCSAAREEFNFCLKTKGKGRAVAERMIREREETRYDIKVHERPSKSVWELRTEPPPNFPPA
ncbi:hypothetical protein BDZ88DRAFT_449912 [Geranomyces variabilis]|nr:hypothetical protein BDZ88DRAFT_449912 [Geranomyces variabilis]KAJ3137241.1 hypothetical protein HDU90_002027 [Geranomyces variabilis]